jgi:hypothetical protein
MIDHITRAVGKDPLIWEPACGNGNLVNGLKARGFRVVGTDILTGSDFMETRRPCDMILTNPPFSIKEKFLGRCYNLGIPFALLMPITTFDAKDRRELMAQHGIEVVLPSRRVNFETPNHQKNLEAGKKTTSWFYSAWFTHGLNIGRQLTFTDRR